MLNPIIMDLFSLTFATLFGLAIGSFLTVCIHRIPQGRTRGLDSLKEDDADPVIVPTGITLTSPRRSICPHCLTQLRWFHNIPVISWCMLRGKCAFCKTSISSRYPFVELLSAAAAAGAVLHFGISPTTALVFLYCAILIVISFIDIDYFIIPNVISLPGTVLGLMVGCLNGFLHIFGPPVAQNGLQSAIGVVIAAGFLWGVAALYQWVRRREGLGFGDIKLIAMTGAFFGLEAAIYTIFFGSLIGSVLGILGMLFKRQGLGQPLPFGPYLALGTVLYLFAGEQLLLQLQLLIIPAGAP